jgi:CNT family concentrative nucleoside transporter
MADLSREHNGSPMPGVHPNPDPALDISREHHHSHLNHTAFAEKGHHDNVVYSTGTTAEPSVVPTSIHPDQSHRRRHADTEHDIEKTGAFYETEHSMEKDTHHSDTSETRDDRRKQQFGLLFPLILFWRQYGRIIVHIFVGTVMTG